MSYLVLLGGVRSGKSRLAVDLAAGYERDVVFVATAERGDDEMVARIDAHRAERPESWTTREAPRALSEALSAIDDAAVVIVDCATLWIANLMLADTPDPEVLQQAERVARQLASRVGPSILVTNEVGMGVHPSSDQGRRYRDLLGAVNVCLAAPADQVALVVAGRALPLRSAAELHQP